MTARRDRWWRQRDRPFLLGLAGVFVVSRLAYFAAGVRFTDRQLEDGFQILDRVQLQDAPLQSLWNLHAQPPLFNAYLAGVLALPGGPRPVLIATYWALGLALSALLFLLMRELGVGVWIAAVLTGLFMVSPGTALFESYLIYTYPVAVTLVLAGWSLIRALRTRATGYIVLFAASLATVGLLRSTYHLVFVVGGAAFLVVMIGPEQRRRALAAVAVPVLLVGAVYLKNWVVFDSPNASSWLGMNLGKMVFQFEDRAELEAAVRRGEVSRQVLTPPFLTIDVFTDDLPDTGIPVLDDVKKANGEPNFNNEGFLDVSRTYQRDALHWIREHPSHYARLVGYALRFSMLPAENSVGTVENLDPVRPFANAWNRALGQQRSSYQLVPFAVQSDLAGASPTARDIPWVIVAMYLLAFSVPFIVAWSFLRRRPGDTNVRATLFFLGAVVIYTTTVSNLLELPENNRFRFETDPLVCVLVAVAVSRAWDHWRARRARRAHPVASG